MVNQNGKGFFEAEGNLFSVHFFRFQKIIDKMTTG